MGVGSPTYACSVMPFVVGKTVQNSTENFWVTASQTALPLSPPIDEGLSLQRTSYAETPVPCHLWATTSGVVMIPPTPLSGMAFVLSR